MPSQLARQQPQLAADPQGSLREIARHTHAPAKVAAVTLECADDGRDRVGVELHPPIGIEAFQGTQQRQVGNVEQVVEWLCRAPELVRETARERHHLLEELIACTAVAVRTRSREQPALTSVPRGGPGRYARRAAVH